MWKCRHSSSCRIFGQGVVEMSKCPCCKLTTVGDEFLCAKCITHKESCNMSVREIKRELAPLFGGKCFVCHRPFTNKSPFVIHHKYYVPGMKTYKDYSTQQEYYMALRQEVKADREQFLLLCNKHHQSLHRLKRFKPDNLNRLIKAVRMTVD